MTNLQGVSKEDGHDGHGGPAPEGQGQAEEDEELVQRLSKLELKP